MKKKGNKKVFPKAAMAIILALALFMPGATVFANDDEYDVTPQDSRTLSGDWIMIENTTARPDTTEHQIPFYINATEEARAFGATLYRNGSAVELIDLNFTGSIADPEGYVFQEGSQEYYTIYMHYNSSNYIGPGEGLLCTLIVNIITDETLTFTTPLNFGVAALYLTTGGVAKLDTINGSIEIINNPPYTPDAPTGEISCLQGGTYSYETLIPLDPDGDSISNYSGYRYDWGDGSYLSWGYRVKTHKWNGVGEFTLRVKARDYPYGAESNWSEGSLNVTVVAAPPETPTLTGPTTGDVYAPLTFCANTTDPTPGINQVRYHFSFGSGVTITTDWVPEGEEACVERSYSNPGTYEIKVRAEDEYGFGNWSEPFVLEILPVLELEITTTGIGLTLVVTNVGGEELSDISWEATITGGMIIITDTEVNGTVDILGPGKSDETYIPAAGIGLGIFNTIPKINVMASAPNANDAEIEQEFQVILLFVKLK